MENNNNTLLYKLDIKSRSQAKKNNDIKCFRARLNEEDVKKWEELFNKTAIPKKINNGGKVEEYDFKILDYDNAVAKDWVMLHSNIYCKPDDVDEVKAIINNNFKNVEYSNNGRTISTTINYKPKTQKGIWVQKQEKEEEELNYPINIVSYDRANKYGKTHLLLTNLKIHHFLWIEEDEKDKYKKWYNPDYCVLMVRPNHHLKNMGSTPMRNEILEYWKDNLNKGYCWILDDNIKRYVYFNKGKKNAIKSHLIFKILEDLADRYTNVGILSHNLHSFVAEGDANRAVISVNRKCYTSMLINLDAPISFKHRHQEDNFISIESICKGWNTISTNCIMYDKLTSGLDKGGNHDTIYKCGDKTDGEGYRERYEYFVNTSKDLIASGDIKLKEQKEFICRKSLKSKEYHAQAKYDLLENSDNKLVPKKNYSNVNYDHLLKFISTD
jgi:hypothetical protein